MTQPMTQPTTHSTTHSTTQPTTHSTTHSTTQSAGMTRRSVVTLAAALVAPVCAPATAWAAGRVARVESVRQAGPRSVDLVIDSPALGRRAPVRILLPKAFHAAPDRTWPVLYLLHGAGDDYTSWTRETGIEAFTAGKDVLTVMPDAGRTGIPTDWWNCGRPGGPDYETFQVDEVMGILQRDYRAGQARVVAGISTGGYGAMSYAARRAGAFRAAACYSGLPDTRRPGIPAFIQSIVGREGIPPRSLWGSPTAQAGIWRGHNPRDQAACLRGTPLYVSCGSGGGSQPGDPWDAALLESISWLSNRTFAARLGELGIPFTAHFYRGGTHTWPYWWREFLASWPLLADGLGADGLGADSRSSRTRARSAISRSNRASGSRSAAP
jgi:diacylglycerol O-acyltransferase / trehalose O-mycolyltransferase